MSINQEITKELILLQESDKFSKDAWKERHVNPSSKVICEMMNKYVDDYLSILLKLINENNDIEEFDIKRITIIHLDKIKEYSFDTEEKEFVMDFFSKISKIIDLDMENIFQYTGFLPIPALCQYLGLPPISLDE